MKSMLLVVVGAAVVVLVVQGTIQRRTGQRIRDLKKAVRHNAGRIAGGVHSLASTVGVSRPAVPPDTNTFLKQRVESELGHEAGLPLAALNFDAADAVVHVRGTVADQEMAQRVVDRVAAVGGVRGVISMMRLADGTHVEAVAGTPDDEPRMLELGEQVVERITARWPKFTELDVLDSAGHPTRLAQLIAQHTGEPEGQVRSELDQILLAAE